MTRAHRLLRAWMVVAVLGGVVSPALAQVTPEPPVDTALAESRRLIDSLDYERALGVLDVIVPRVERLADEAGRAAYVVALELRGRVQFTLGNQAAAAEDFRRLLAIDPTHVLPSQISPRIVALLEETRRTTIGRIALTVTPADAVVEIDGRRVQAGTVALTAGSHPVDVTRPGYRSLTQSIDVPPGTEMPLAVTLERTAAAVTLITVPPGVEIVVNDASAGVTEAGPLAAGLEALPAKLGVDASRIAQPFVLPSLTPGRYTFRFRKACYTTIDRTVTIDEARDYQLEPVTLTEAVASLTVEAADEGAMVLVDGQTIGPAPLRGYTLCEGDHTIEVRSDTGLHLERVTATPGGALTVQAVLRPAFALVAVAGLPEGYRGQDLRSDVERALRGTRGIALLALPEAAVTAALAADKVSADSFAFDRGRRPVGGATRMSPSVRRDVATRLARALGVQGIATITVTDAGTSLQRAAVALLAVGASAPDVVDIDLADARAVLRAVEVLDASPGLSRAGLGLQLADVEDTDGPLVVQVDAGGPAQTAGVQPGLRIRTVGGVSVDSTAALAAAVDATPDQPATLGVVDRTGAARTVTVTPTRVPRLVSVEDQTLPFNVLAAEWRARARRASQDPDAVMVRLNLAVALLRIGDVEAARETLERVQLPEGAGIAAGTVQYLLGLAHEAAGDLARAREALTKAAAADRAVLSDQGGSVAELAKARLQTLTGPR